MNFDKAHARRTDPQTSYDAAAKVVNLGRTREAILDILKYTSLPDESIVEIYQSRVFSGFDIPKASESGIRSRRAELVKMGLVRNSGFKATIKSGNKAIAWELNK